MVSMVLVLWGVGMGMGMGFKNKVMLHCHMEVKCQRGGTPGIRYRYLIF